MPRLPEIRDKTRVPPEQHHIIDYLVETRGYLSPGFGQIMNNPELAYYIAQLGTKIRFHSPLPDNVRELTALVASAELEGVYEQGLHTRDAAEKGVAQTAIDSVNRLQAVEGATPEEALAVGCARELIRQHQLSEEAFARARAAFGDDGVVQLVATVGYYAMLAFVHNGLLVGR